MVPPLIVNYSPNELIDAIIEYNNKIFYVFDTYHSIAKKLNIKKGAYYQYNEWCFGPYDPNAPNYLIAYVIHKDNEKYYELTDELSMPLLLTPYYPYKVLKQPTKNAHNYIKMF